MLELSADQDKNLKKLIDWCKTNCNVMPNFDPKTSFGKPKFVTLGGYAGTGKTTLISILRQELHKENKDLKVAFCSYTGKASRVLRQKIIQSGGKFDQDSISTIHSLIYSPIVNDREEIVGWELQPKMDKDMIIIDEASMVDGKIWDDLLSFDKPIIAVGDHGQLPPISGNFSLMEKPNLKLEEIHRQAKDNPIIQLSIGARTKGLIPFGDFEGKVRKVSRQDYTAQEELTDMLSNYNTDLLILCGYNNTRVKLNTFIRNSFEYEPNPQAGDRVICLRNNHAKKIFNGMLGTINSILPKNKDYYTAEILMDDEFKPFTGELLRQQFGESRTLNFTENRAITKNVDLFDFGYALTVHKAQGSQAKRVVLFEERFKQMDDEMWRKWLYTAVTRAEEELFIVGD